MGIKVSETEREACAFSLREQKAKHDFAFDARSPGCHENSLSPRNAIADLWHIISQDRNTSQTRCIVQTMAQCWGGEKRTRSTKETLHTISQYSHTKWCKSKILYICVCRRNVVRFAIVW